MSTSWRKSSKIDWHSDKLQGCVDGFIGIEKINAGSLMRIADAVEKMAQRHTELIEERDRYKRWYDEEREVSNKQKHRVRGLRGAISKMKRANGYFRTH